MLDLEQNNAPVPGEIVPAQKQPNSLFRRSRKSLMAAITFAGISLADCDNTKEHSSRQPPTPQLQESKPKSQRSVERELAIKESQPTSEETKFFAQTFTVKRKEFVKNNGKTEWVKKEWITPDLQQQVVEGFARLAKSFKLTMEQKNSLRQNLQYTLATNNFYYYPNDQETWGEAPGNDDVIVGGRHYVAPILFHELSHKIFIPRWQKGEVVYTLYNEGTTEIFARIAFPDNPHTSYHAQTLLVAALGPEFYARPLKNRTYARSAIRLVPNKYQLAFPHLMQKDLDAFAKKWSITKKEDQELLKKIFFNDKDEFEAPSWDNAIGQEVQNLKTLLARYNIGWEDFLEEISPPSKTFLWDWGRI